MKRDIQIIESLKKASKKEQEEFFQKNFKDLQNTIFSYSFLPDVYSLVLDAFYKSINSYQESTPVIFHFYASKEINQALLRHTNQFIKDHNISYSVSFLRYFKMISTPIEGDNYLNLMQIGEVLGVGKISSIQSEMTRVIKSKNPVLDIIFPNYQQNLKMKRQLNRENLEKRENLLTDQEIEFLNLFLGKENDICLDISEIASRFNKSSITIRTILKDAYLKIDKYSDAKRQWEEQYGSDTSLYNIRKKSLFEIDKIKPISKEKKVNSTEEENSKKEEIPKSYLSYLKEQLTQNEHGFYRTKKEVAKRLGLGYTTVLVYYQKILENYKTNPQFRKQLDKEIPNFKVLFEDYQDSTMKGKLSRRDIKILELRQDKNNQEIARIISQDGLHFDEVYVAKELIKIAQAFSRNPSLEQDFLNNHPGYIFDPKKRDVSYEPIKNILLEYLKEQLTKNADGTFPTYQQIAKSLGKKPSNINACAFRVQKYVKTEKGLASAQKQIPNFDILWQEYLNSKGKKATKNNYEKIILTLKEVLTQDEHGFFASYDDINRKTNFSKRSIASYILKIKQELIYDEKFYEKARTEIPNFDVLWQEYLDYKTKGVLSKRQTQILELTYYKKQDGTYKKRRFKEIANLISQDGLHFDEVYVREAKKSITFLFNNHKEVEEEFVKTHPIYKKAKPKAKLSYSKHKKLSPREMDVLTNLLKIDEHGLFPGKPEIALKLNTTLNNVNQLYYLLSKKLIWQEAKEQVREQIPNFDVLWEEYLDSRVKNALSKRQTQILELTYYHDQDGIYKRSNEEIAEIMSEDGLRFDSSYVEKMLKKANALFRRNKRVKESFLESHPEWQEDFPNTNQLLTSKEIAILSCMITKDNNDSYPLKKEIAEKFEMTPNYTSQICSIIKHKLEDSEAKKQAQEQIPNFDTLWEEYSEKHILKRETSEVAIIKEKYKLKEGHYLSQEERAKKLKMSIKHLQIRELTFLEKLKDQEQETSYFLKHPELKEKHYIYWNYQSLEEQNEKTFEAALNSLENSYFKDFIACCEENHKKALAFRLGYYDHQIHSPQEVAEAFKMTQKEVSLLTTLCLNFGKDAIHQNMVDSISKQKQKKEV